MAHIGDILKGLKSEIPMQFIHDAIVNIKDKKRTCDTEITFATQEMTANDFRCGGDKVGVILWVSREEYNESITKLNKLQK